MHMARMNPSSQTSDATENRGEDSITSGAQLWKCCFQRSESSWRKLKVEINNWHWLYVKEFFFYALSSSSPLSILLSSSNSVLA